MLDYLEKTIQPFIEWAAKEQRILLTHDVATITRYAYERLAKGKSMPGVIEVTSDASIGMVIEDVILILSCSLDGEIEGQILYLPFK